MDLTGRAGAARPRSAPLGSRRSRRLPSPGHAGEPARAGRPRPRRAGGAGRSDQPPPSSPRQSRGGRPKRLFGGLGTVLGAVIGLLIMQVVRSRLVSCDVDPHWQTVSVGLIMIVAVGIDLLRQRMKSR